MDNAVFAVIENTGVKITDEFSKDLLYSLGAKVCDKDIIKIPSSLVKNAIKSAPKSINIYDRNGNLSMKLNDRNIYFGSNSNLINYLDPYTGKTINFESKHSKITARIADYLPNIDFLAIGPMMSDIQANLKGRLCFSIAIKNTVKPINSSTDEYESFSDTLDLAAEFAGGYDKLKEKPFFFHYCQPISPLRHSDDGCEKLRTCSEKGIPVVYMPYTMAGATAPLSFASSLIQCYAEILSVLVIHQAISEGSPFIIGAMPSTIDMKTTVATYGALEFHLMVAAAAEIANYYKIPFFGTGGCTDSKSLDYQTIAEATMSLMSSMLSCANLVHDIGYMDHGNINCPELTVLSDETINMLKPIRRGIDFKKHELCLDIINEVGPGGNYLKHEHTLHNYKKIWYSNLFDHSMTGNIDSLNKKINEKTIEIIENHIPQPLSKEKLDIIDKHEKIWHKKYYNK